jgi:two-component system sensor histidine kinase TtrS
MRACFSVLIRALCALCLLAGNLVASAAAGDVDVRIGVLAYRGPDETGTSWSDLPKRLAQTIPGHHFEIIELPGPKLAEAVEHNELDFVLTNSTQYVALAAEFGIRRIATVMLPETLSQQQAIGSTILTLAERTDIGQLADLQGKRIAAVASDAFGGYLSGARELLGAGVDLEAGDARMVYVGSPMRRVMQALLDGQADAVIVRTCLLEQLSTKGIVAFDEFKVLAPKRIPGFGCAASTPLYPDWPMAATQRVDAHLARQFAMALLSMPPSPNGLYWDVPADYQPVSDLFRELMIGPYLDLRSTTVRGILKTYRPHVIAAATLLALLFIYLAWLAMRHTAELRAAREQARELQKEAEHMARLSILGEMAGTLAHELNQPLATIATYAQGLERRCAAGPVDPAILAEANREIVAQTERADQVIRRVRAFTKKRMAVRECKSIGHTVEEAVQLFAHLLPDLPDIAIDDWLPLGAQLEADHLQLQEVLLNLMKNAADAMRDLPPGEREIDIRLDKGDGLVSITVADRGPPVPPETFAHLFEAFFTTKADGLGLGLAICKSIAEAHGGRLEVAHRNPPPGLAFTISLPVGICHGQSSSHPRR